MPFPFSAKGVIIVDDPKASGLSAAMTAVEAAIRQERPGRLDRHDQNMRFTGGVFRSVGRWNMLVPISSGELRFAWEDKKAVIRYRLSFLQLLILVTALMTGFFFCVKQSWQAAVLGWLWLFGMNYLLAVCRFPSLIRRAVKE